MRNIIFLMKPDVEDAVSISFDRPLGILLKTRMKCGRKKDWR